MKFELPSDKEILTGNGTNHWVLGDVRPIIKYNSATKVLYIAMITPGKLGRNFVKSLPMKIGNALKSFDVETIHIDLRGNVGGIPYVFLASLLSNIVPCDSNVELDAEGNPLEVQTLLWSVSNDNSKPVPLIQINGLYEYLVHVRDSQGLLIYTEKHISPHPMYWANKKENIAHESKNIQFKVSVNNMSQSSSQLIMVMLKDMGAIIDGRANMDCTNAPITMKKYRYFKVPYGRFANKHGDVYVGSDIIKAADYKLPPLNAKIMLLKDSVVRQVVDEEIWLETTSIYHRFVQERFNISQPSNPHIVDTFVLHKNHPSFKKGVLNIINPSGYVSCGNINRTSPYVKKTTINNVYKSEWICMNIWLKNTNYEKPIYLDARGYSEWGLGAAYTFEKFIDTDYIMKSSDNQSIVSSHTRTKSPLQNKAIKYILVIDEMFGKFADVETLTILTYFQEHHTVIGRYRCNMLPLTKVMGVVEWCKDVVTKKGNSLSLKADILAPSNVMISLKPLSRFECNSS